MGHGGGWCDVSRRISIGQHNMRMVGRHLGKNHWSKYQLQGCRQHPWLPVQHLNSHVRPLKLGDLLETV